ncbi:MAG: hypothetical protein LWW94_08495, partial [Candidatus Desulfofervidaceae bacterium]|nr:hypothetical protein [Candidatus Desulfofervidaceae bacterium]
SEKRAIIDASKGLLAEYAKVYGPVVVFKSLWEKTGLKRIMERFAKESNCEFDLVSTIFALVLKKGQMGFCLCLRRLSLLTPMK